MRNRCENWESEHVKVIQFHSEKSGQYGISDCYFLADDNVRAVTGNYMFPKGRNYKSKVGAAKLLLKHGFHNVEEAFAAKFEEIPPILAQRGDIGVIEQNGEICGGVFTALGFAVRGEDRLYYMSVYDVKTAFKVGR